MDGCGRSLRRVADRRHGRARRLSVRARPARSGTNVASAATRSATATQLRRPVCARGMLEPRPEETTRRQSRPLRRAAIQQTGRDCGGGTTTEADEDEHEQERRLRSRDVPQTEDAREGQRETIARDDRGNDGAERDTVPERNHSAAPARSRAAYAEPLGSARGPPIRHHQQPEASETAKVALQIADHQKPETRRRGIDDRCPGCAVQGHAAVGRGALGAARGEEGAASATAGTSPGRSSRIFPVLTAMHVMRYSRLIGRRRSSGRIGHSSRPSPPLGSALDQPRRWSAYWAQMSRTEILVLLLAGLYPGGAPSPGLQHAWR